MVTVLIWPLGSRLLWIFMLLGSTSHPAVCNFDVERLVTADSEGTRDISTFASADEALGAKIASAVKVNLGDDTNFNNAGSVGSNTIHNAQNSIINTEELSARSRYSKKQPLHGKTDLRTRFEPSMDTDDLGQSAPSKRRTARQSDAQTAVNLDLSGGSSFVNDGNIGSNLAQYTNVKPKLSYIYPTPGLKREKLSTALNMKLGSAGRFDNKGNIASNLVRHNAQSYHSPKGQGSPRSKPVYSTRNGFVTPDIVGPYYRMSFPHFPGTTINSAANLKLGTQTTFGNRGKIGSNQLYQQFQPGNINAAANLVTGYGTQFDNEDYIGSNLLHTTSRRSMLQGLPSINAAANVDVGYGGQLYNKGYIGSNVLYDTASGSMYDNEGYRRIPIPLRPRNINAASRKIDYVDKMYSNGNLPGYTRSDVPGTYVRFPSLRSAGNSEFYNGNSVRGAPSRQKNTARNVFRQFSEKRVDYPEYDNIMCPIDGTKHRDNENLSRASSVMHDPETNDRYSAAPSLGRNEDGRSSGSEFYDYPYYKRNPLANFDGANGGWTVKRPFVYVQQRPGYSSLHSSVNLYLPPSSSINNEGEIGSNIVRHFNNRPVRSVNIKGEVNVDLASGSSMNNEGYIGSKSIHKPQIRTRHPDFVSVYNSANVGDTGNGSSFNKNYSTYALGPNTKAVYSATGRNKRSTFTNTGKIGAAEVLLSRGSVMSSNGTQTNTSRAPLGQVSFGKLGVDMTNSSNYASITAGDNSQIVIYGKVGTYHISIPIGSVLASESSGISLRTFEPSWSDFFYRSSTVDLRSSLNFVRNLHSTITGVVKVTSQGANNSEKVEVCELENPITAIEIGRPLLSHKLLLELLYITKLRINFANLLAYMTAKYKGRLDAKPYEAIQLLYNAIQYRQVNLIPLLHFLKHLKTMPQDIHSKIMFSALIHVVPEQILNPLYQSSMIQDDKHISHNLMSILTDTLDLDMVPYELSQLRRDILIGNVSVFVEKVVEKTFQKIKRIKSVRELKDIVYLTILNLPLNYSVPQLPVKLRLLAQMLLMELPDDAWICAAISAQHVSLSNVYRDLKRFLALLQGCPKVPENIRAVVWHAIQVLPDAVPPNDVSLLNISGTASTAAQAMWGNMTSDGNSTLGSENLGE